MQLSKARDRELIDEGGRPASIVRRGERGTRQRNPSTSKSKSMSHCRRRAEAQDGEQRRTGRRLPPPGGIAAIRRRCRRRDRGSTARTTRNASKAKPASRSPATAACFRAAYCCRTACSSAGRPTRTAGRAAASIALRCREICRWRRRRKDRSQSQHEQAESTRRSERRAGLRTTT